MDPVPCYGVVPADQSSGEVRNTPVLIVEENLHKKIDHAWIFQ
jgi:hypothetical protein